jgi:hypothetical protein
VWPSVVVSNGRRERVAIGAQPRDVGRASPVISRRELTKWSARSAAARGFL